MSTNDKLVQREDFLIEACRGKRVLHLGCTNAPYTKEAIDSNMLLHFQLEKVAAEICGIDNDEEGLSQLRKRGSERLYHADLEQFDELSLEQDFDVIVAGEIVEHLDNPGLFLDGVRRFMGADTRLVITTINAYCAFRTFYYAFRGRRGTAEPVHPDHVAYYSYRTLTTLLERHGMQADKLLFYDIGREHRQFNRWFLNAVNDLAVSIAPQLADGIIAVCRLSNDDAKPAA